MNICVFNVSFWDTQYQANQLKDQFIEWGSRVEKFLHIRSKDIFISEGSHSNIEYKPTHYNFIQHGIERQLDQKVRINYFRAGFLSALYYFLHNKNELKWDIIAFVHYSVLLGIDFKPYLNQFMDRKESLMAPQLLTPDGVMIENGLMFMKDSAVKRWILNSSIKDPMCGNEYIITEEETTLLFLNDWYNPFHDITSIRKNPIPTTHTTNSFSRNFELTESQLLKAPAIFSLSKHCDESIIHKWKDCHP